MKRLVQILIAVSVLFLVTSPARAGKIRFAPANTFSSGINNPAWVVAGDFNGDDSPTLR